MEVTRITVSACTLRKCSECLQAHSNKRTYEQNVPAAC